MLIFHHLIKNEAIVGIGPLMHEQSKDPASALLHGTCRYFFELHLSGHTTTIYSPWFHPKSEDKDAETMRKWKEEYFHNSKQIANWFAGMIAEPC